ncbi:MAG: hypothetical protein AAF799_08320 [Myxococcota bacterium]
MLNLDEPIGVVAGLSLYRDHALPQRVHYLPTQPALAQSDDATPVSFIKVRGHDPTRDDGAGLLLLSTELTASEDQLDEARQYLSAQGMPQAQLQPVDFRDGKAVFVAALAEGDGFVERLFGDVTPELLGRNRAVFSLQLSEDGAQLVEAMLAPDGPGGLGVRYELEFVGLRPSLEARVRADYGRIHDELSANLDVGVAHDEVGAKANVSSSTRKLVEEGAIEIEILRFEDDDALRERIDRTLKWFQEEIIDAMFERRLTGSGNPVDRVLGDVVDAAEDSAANGTRTHANFSAELSLKELNQEERRIIEIDWSEAKAQTRTIAPQGLLSELGERTRRVEVDPDDDLWKKLDVPVRAQGDFESLGVQRLVVQMAYPDQAQPDATRATFVFEPGQPEPRNFATYTNGGSRQYQTQREVLFASEGPWPGPASFNGEWVTTGAFELLVHPLSGVPRLELELAAGSMSFEDTPQVQVQVRVDGEEIANEKLSESTPSVTVRRRLEPPEPPETAETPEDEESAPRGPVIETRCTWFHADGTQTEGEWAPLAGRIVLVGSPWRSHREVRVFPLLPPDVMDASVTLSMDDGGQLREASVAFLPGERGAKVVRLPSMSEQPPPVQVAIAVVDGEGGFFERNFETTDAVVIVRDREGEHRQVPIRLLAGPRLIDHGVIAVRVDVVDDANTVIDSVVFTQSRREGGPLMVPSDPPQGSALRYRVTRFGPDGTAAPSQWVEESAGRLLVMAAMPTEG